MRRHESEKLGAREFARAIVAQAALTAARAWRRQDVSDVHCAEAMQLVNQVFGSGLIFNDGHEIHARLEKGDDLGDILVELNSKFGKPRRAEAMRRVVAGWPHLHREAVEKMVHWALGKLDTEDRILISYKGDAQSEDTVTRFEFRDHTLLIEFSHPPATRSPSASAIA